MSRRPPVVAAFALWTLYVWLTRIANIAGDDDPARGAAVGGLLVAMTSVLLAAAVLVAWGRGVAVRSAVVVLTVWTVAVWVPRLGSLLADDHSGAFKVVHVGLAAVSIVLGVWAWRRVSRPAAARPRSRALSP